MVLFSLFRVCARSCRCSPCSTTHSCATIINFVSRVARDEVSLQRRPAAAGKAKIRPLCFATEVNGDDNKFNGEGGTAIVSDDKGNAYLNKILSHKTTYFIRST